MRFSLLSLFVVTISTLSIAQEYNPIVEELINGTNLDSLVKYTRELTGEDSVMINGSMVLIQNRIYYQNDLAAEYIKHKLTQFGLNPVEQQYSTDGKNIYAIQQGSVYPDEKFILCAHYDAVADYCADDDASGCVAVLEAARLLSQMEFEYTLLYAFWDEEETGLYGSEFYASEASQNNEIINGVLDLEMFGWDSDNDMSFDIHTRDYANSIELADLLVSIDETYDLMLEPIIHNPGTTASDHSSFWDHGYTAVVYSEAFFSGDGNPYYHTSDDRIEHFNLPYFHELTKLAVASITTLAEPIITTVTDMDLAYASEEIQIRNYPNPFRKETTIAFNMQKEGIARISVYNVMGREIDILVNKYFHSGENEIKFQPVHLPKGMYIIRLESISGIASSMMILN